MKQMKKKLLCVCIPAVPLSHQLLQGWRSLGFLFYYSTLLSTELLHKIWVLCKTFLNQFQPLWRKLKREGGYPSLPDAFCWFKDRTWRACLLGEFWSAESPMPQGKGGCPVFERERRSRGTMAQLPGLVVDVPLLTYSHQFWLGKRQRVKECPAPLSCALGTNSISQ